MRFIGIEKHVDFWRSGIDRVARDIAAQSETTEETPAASEG
jgi:hypothetical protein